MINVIKRGRGRPKQNVRSDNHVHVRMNVGEKAMLDLMAEEMGIPKSKVLKIAMKKMYKETR